MRQKAGSSKMNNKTDNHLVNLTNKKEVRYKLLTLEKKEGWAITSKTMDIKD